jgi:hypothetical protein
MTAEFIQPDKADRRMQDPNMLLVAARLKTFEASFDEMRGDMRRMAEAVTKLAIVEERQTAATAAQDRAFKAISEVQADVRVVVTRISSLELAGVNSKRTSAWIDKAALAVLAVVAMFIAAKVGLH